jgi:formyl-CoA transferase
MANMFAAPLIGAMLGDLGAEVVKVEPPGGDQFRMLGSGADPNRPNSWTLVTRNKRMVTVDTSTAEGLDLLHRLTAVADVILLNHPRTLLERLDSTYEAIAARNPRAVVVNASTFGTSGPYADRTGNGSLAEAFSGLTDNFRGSGGRPFLTPLPLGDHLTALAGVIGTVAACYWRDARGGQGQYVDLAQYEAVLTMLGPRVISWLPDHPPVGADSTRSSGLRGTFQTADGQWVTVTAYSDAQITRLLTAVGVDVPSEGASAEQLAALAEEWIGTRDRQTVVDALLAARIQISPINDITALLADPHVQHRQSIVEVSDPVLGPVRVLNPTPRLTATAGRVRWINRPLGADNDAVYGEWLGLSPDEITKLRHVAAM